MSWLKKIKPVILYQSSDIPYVILEDGVRLCFDNVYYNKQDQSEFNIIFKANKNHLMRQSANYYRFKKFPVIIPFRDIIKLNKTIIDGHIVKNTVHHSEQITIALVKSSYLDDLDDDDLSRFVDTLDRYKNSFVLIQEEQNSKTHLLEDFAHIINHVNYYRTCVQIADAICSLKLRKYCWTRNITDLTVHCFGLIDSDEKNKISSALEYIGISNFDVTWKD